MAVAADRGGHLGGGRKGLFLILRYLFIVAASYMLIFRGQSVTSTGSAMMIAAALASNFALSFVAEARLFAWYVEAPILIGDTLWVSWAIHCSGTNGQEFFLLYFFVLFLAALAESLPLVVFGSTAVAAANIFLAVEAERWSTPNLLKLAFFYTVALFYGHVATETRKQRQLAKRGIARAMELEAKVAERTRELVRLCDESVAAGRAKTEFIANMSHELRTPLNIILGYVEVLLDHESGPQTDAERDDLLHRVQRSAYSQARLVDSILDIGRIDSGNLPVDHLPVPLASVVADVQQRARIPSNDVALTWQVTCSSPLLETDPTKLSVVLETLIDNAVKFTRAGHITVSVQDRPQDHRVEFSVEDTGPGIPAAEMHTIFEPFVQLGDPANQFEGGAGLGLTLVDRYVKLLGGKVAVQSNLGGGSRFTVTLPYSATAAEGRHSVG